MRKKVFIALCICISASVLLFILLSLLSEQVTLVSSCRLAETPQLETVDLFDHMLTISTRESKATPYYLKIDLDELGKIRSYELCSYTYTGILDFYIVSVYDCQKETVVHSTYIGDAKSFAAWLPDSCLCVDDSFRANTLNLIRTLSSGIAGLADSSPIIYCDGRVFDSSGLIYHEEGKRVD